ncbi:hypothetical protein ABMA27_014297 [Loxostege sticticalis]|uniref:C2H2-type domain-containing protein n=1 Tax=Loxostege sticticalis TaxID=481309 RepID=A0ABR3IDG6_LOXSC
MLSPRDDDDDDNHLCIKCNATIVGLDNYVKHRKERCGKNTKTSTSKSEIPNIDSLDPTYSLGADVFFQSLELQSSVKKTSLSRLTPPISKAVLDIKTTLSEASTSRDIPRMSPLTNLREEDWIGEPSLRINSNEDNQTKLINAVASISGTAKKPIPTTTYSIANYNDYKVDVDFEESDDSEDEDEEERKWKPPINYTGGKWRPASPDHEDWDIKEEDEHTGGKWKPIMHDSHERDDDYDAPPPGHTKGKWVPGHEKTQIMQTTLQNKGSVQYWCGPCNRRLGSRAIYEKHLLSSLHMRKVLPEHELEFSGHLEPMRPIDKRTLRPSRFTNDSIYTGIEKKKPKTPKPKLGVKIEKKKRKRKPVYVHCSGCKSRVRLHLMGKHLISHYHFRKANNIKSEAYQQFILDNIDAIVHQSPFQCSPCKFYTNWLSNFMQHWYSEEHESKTASLDGRYWCSFCKYECNTSQGMLEHMSGSDHSEVVAVINRSMPIIIRRRTIFKCETCSEEFRYNIELKRHSAKTGHKLPYTATDDYQELHNCQFCKAKFKSSLTLAAHLKFKHKQKEFLCLVCSKMFKTSSEAKHHRYTLEHRIRKQEIIKEKGLPSKDLTKKCPYCTDLTILKNVLELKEHIRVEHPNIKKNCPKCGMSFIFPQEVSRHLKNNACQFPSTSTLNSSIVWNCSQCLFATDSQAECYFHETLHGDSINEVRKVGDKDTVIIKYTCPLCPKVFRKASLRAHLKLHTYERPFACTICGANFSRQSTLANHTKSVHGEGVGKVTKMKKVVIPVPHSLKDTWSCSKCSKMFTNRSALSRHECDAGDRSCPHEGCAYVAPTPSLLARHRRTHGEKVKYHECKLCAFQTDQASHLKRHMRCHEGVKPYFCPHCEFTCGSLENLRKHALRSSAHLGASLYHCSACAFHTNMAANLRKHLVADHGDKYDKKTATKAVTMWLMKKDVRPVKTEPPE